MHGWPLAFKCRTSCAQTGTLDGCRAGWVTHQRIWRQRAQLLALHAVVDQVKRQVVRGARRHIAAFSQWDAHARVAIRVLTELGHAQACAREHTRFGDLAQVFVCLCVLAPSLLVRRTDCS